MIRVLSRFLKQLIFTKFISCSPCWVSIMLLLSEMVIWLVLLLRKTFWRKQEIKLCGSNFINIFLNNIIVIYSFNFKQKKSIFIKPKTFFCCNKIFKQERNFLLFTVSYSRRQKKGNINRLFINKREDFILR